MLLDAWQRRWSALPPRARDAAGVLLLAAVLAGLSVRLSHKLVIPGEPQASAAQGRNGMADFRDVIYYPVTAVREGINPYDSDRRTPLPDGSPRYWNRYPVLNLFPLYSPLVLLVYWPFAYPPFVPAVIAYAALNVGLMLLWSWALWRCAGQAATVGGVAGLAAVMLFTQAGRANFLGGETTLPLALGSLAAAALAKDRPGLAGLALALTSFKPTFGLPLGILLACRRDWSTVALGWGLGFVVGVTGLVFLFARSGDLRRMPEVLLHNQADLESDPDVDPRYSATRVDSAGAIERLLPIGGRAVQLGAAAAVLALAGAGLWKLAAARGRPETEMLSQAIIGLATVSGIYHLNYDAVLLWLPLALVALAPDAWWRPAGRPWRWTVVALLLVPQFNALGTQSFQALYRQWGLAAEHSALPEPLWTIVCTLNGLALLAALALLVRHAWRITATARLA